MTAAELTEIEQLSTDELATALRAQAAGMYRDEAGAELLIACESAGWLDRRDFRRRYMGYTREAWNSATPVAWVEWDKIAQDVASNEFVVASGSAVRIVQIAGSLAGKLAVHLDEVLSGLDATNTRHVLDAIARCRGWHEDGRTATITGRFND